MIVAPVEGVTTWAVPTANLCLQGEPPYLFQLLVIQQTHPNVFERRVALSYVQTGMALTFTFTTAPADDLANGVINLGASLSKMEARVLQISGSNEYILSTDTLKVS